MASRSRRAAGGVRVRWWRVVDGGVVHDLASIGRWTVSVNRCDWTDGTHSWIATAGDAAWYCRAEYTTERAARRAAVALARRLAGGRWARSPSSRCPRRADTSSRVETRVGIGT